MAWFSFVMFHLNKPQDFWNNVLWTDQTKVEMFGLDAQQHVWRKPNTANQHKHLIPTVKHGGGGLMIWACSAATGPGHLAVQNLHDKMYIVLVKPKPDFNHAC